MPIVISGEGLTIADIAAVGRGGTVALTTDAGILERFRRSRDVIRRGVGEGQEIYGVTTLYGGMANARITRDQLVELQKISLWHHKSTTGPRLPEADVRAAMLLRANSLIKGASGVRLELVERLIAFLNAKAHPHVYQRGSIGASGDLVPLSYIAGAILGLDKAYLVEMGGATLDSHSALAKLGLAPLTLEPKEGLALNNGTGACTGVAANVCARAFDLTCLALAIHALFAQALVATDQSFQPFIHVVKPHPG
ncbi:MAG: aromatic amino acid lyase, partial [Hyphomicrobiales bacterium]|nr:aromatic amino acid lyase [Hyphomicrobiales bacterium]